MATSSAFMEYCIDTLGRGVGGDNLSVRKMFGEYALYYQGVTIGLICDETVFIKITPFTDTFLKRNHITPETGFPYPGAKSWYILDEDLMENFEMILELFDGMYEEKERGEKKKKTRSK